MGKKNVRKRIKTNDNEQNERLATLETCTVDNIWCSQKATFVQRNDHMIVDSGASVHLVVDWDLSHLIQEAQVVTVELANGSRAKTKYLGKVSARLAKLIVVLSSEFDMLKLEMNALSC